MEEEEAMPYVPLPDCDTQPIASCDDSQPLLPYCDSQPLLDDAKDSVMVVEDTQVASPASGQQADVLAPAPCTPPMLAADVLAPAPRAPPMLAAGVIAPAPRTPPMLAAGVIAPAPRTPPMLTAAQCSPTIPCTPSSASPRKSFPTAAEAQQTPESEVRPKARPTSWSLKRKLPSQTIDLDSSGGDDNDGQAQSSHAAQRALSIHRHVSWLLIALGIVSALVLVSRQLQRQIAKLVVLVQFQSKSSTTGWTNSTLISLTPQNCHEQLSRIQKHFTNGIAFHAYYAGCDSPGISLGWMEQFLEVKMDINVGVHWESACDIDETCRSLLLALKYKRVNGNLVSRMPK
eukprot:TRINITY_DN6528_c0_g1_i4.p1 TRINITY_DN6528_c0_g1~~TRINITY_DN6528_c0_g1_i4.p1  ORF type:complete len:345 (+),score=71.66 TRINITY_DN6528_c0_g1_i4:101-1135(+)